MREKKVRWGLIGLGHRARGLAHIYHHLVPNSTVVAVCDRIETLAHKTKEILKDPDIAIYTDHRKMLKESLIDAVSVFVAPEQNPDIVCECLEAGKHVLCEVPLSLTMEGCWKVVITVEKTGLKFQMAEQLRYAAFVKAWKKMIEKGLLGKILYCEGQYLHGMGPDRYWMDTETGEKVSISQAKNYQGKLMKTRFWNLKHPIFYLPHELSPLLHILDDRVVKVVGMATKSPGYRYEWFPQADIEVSLMHTEKDTILRLMAGFVIETLTGSEHCNRVIGTKGWVEQPRTKSEKGRMWLSDHFMSDAAELEWNYSNYWESPSVAAETGHGGLDFYPVANMVEAIIYDRPVEMDVYRAAETAAPAILAGMSIEKDSIPINVPDFRPGEKRKPGTLPEKLY
ncbi:MAG TPA: Gfo/Idh/MocA family oxidoreductase [bacterium]|nr:Gfo/Idh/MocA family oxidoreductase [bacterium]